MSQLPDKPNPSEVVPGSPGYRTRTGSSGYDYIDTQTERARMEGTFIRNFLQARLVTHSVVGVMFLIIGFGFSALFAFMTINELLTGSFTFTEGGLFFLLLGYFTLVFGRGAYLSLHVILDKSSDNDHT